MKIIPRSQRGFSILEVVLIVVVAGLIGGVGWWAWQKNRTKVGDAAPNSHPSTSQEQKADAAAQPPKSSTTFTSIAGGFSFTYPQGWEVTDLAPTSDNPNEYIYIIPPSYVATSNADNLSATLIVSNNPDVRLGDFTDGTVQVLSNTLRLWVVDSDHAKHAVSGETVDCAGLAIVSDDGAHFSHPLPNGKNLALVAGYCNGERQTTTMSYQAQINGADWKKLVGIISSITFK